MRGWVVKLDRGFPLVKITEGPKRGQQIRCQHATSLIKSKNIRAVIGDNVDVDASHNAEMAQITAIHPRSCVLVRRDPAERTESQIMAANFDAVMIVEPIIHLNMHRLERELVVAHATGAHVAVILTKVDLLDRDDVAAYVRDVSHIVAPGVDVIPVSVKTAHEANLRAQNGSQIDLQHIGTTDAGAQGIQAIRNHIPGGAKVVLLGRSGAGKSSIVNALVGKQIQQTTQVRTSDGKGRHTTVSRYAVPIPDGGYVIDMPGTRGMGMWQSEEGIAAAFPDITYLAQACKFRDCTHHSEPGCAVRKAVDNGKLSEERLHAYQDLVSENKMQAHKAEIAQHIREHPGRPPRYSRHRKPKG